MMRALPPSTTESGMIPQVCASPFQPHRGRIRVGGADFEVRRPKVVAMHLPRFSTFLRDPVVPSCIVLSEFLVLCLGEGDGQWGRHGTRHPLC